MHALIELYRFPDLADVLVQRADFCLPKIGHIQAHGGLQCPGDPHLAHDMWFQLLLQPKLREIKMIAGSWEDAGVAECVQLSAGLDYARGDAVIIMDADLQDPPELIPALIDRWEAGAEIVLARRTRPYTS